MLLLAACTHREDDLLSRVKQALAERDRKLASYRFSAEATQGDQVARHAFAFRSPNKMHGVVLSPARLEWSFDGTSLYQSLPAEKKLKVFTLELPPAKAAYFLHQTFAPFVFEGFRTPLLPSTSVTAKRVADAKGDAVELSIHLSDENGPLEVRYRLKWPSADFLSRSSTEGGVASELKVEEEQCDGELGLCVPKVVSQTSGGQLVGRTRLYDIDLAAATSADDFTLRAPEGWTTEPHEVVETGQ